MRSGGLHRRSVYLQPTKEIQTPASPRDASNSSTRADVYIRHLIAARQRTGERVMRASSQESQEDCESGAGI
jgi:hypothetical protein